MAFSSQTATVVFHQSSNVDDIIIFLVTIATVTTVNDKYLVE